MTQIKKAAGSTAAWESSRQNISSLSPLIELRSNGVMPKSGLIWIGLGCCPPKRNALTIDPERLPTDEECKSVAGLDVVLMVNGYLSKYSPLRKLCGSLLAARPRRLQVIDLDYKRIAFLKNGGCR
ncbi:hypothetical protein [Herbaspirillum sp. ST 5-3]|uniref:hypothetical protein n=1 Tax=Oxalobacteraceae TaxID=75682 RepID=UPI0010A4F9B4|nr:hypothetical protein [Herbaspirillum sp. ST 5-3]